MFPVYLNKVFPYHIFSPDDEDPPWDVPVGLAHVDPLDAAMEDQVGKLKQTIADKRLPNWFLSLLT